MTRQQLYRIFSISLTIIGAAGLINSIGNLVHAIKGADVLVWPRWLQACLLAVMVLAMLAALYAGVRLHWKKPDDHDDGSHEV